MVEAYKVLLHRADLSIIRALQSIGARSISVTDHLRDDAFLDRITRSLLIRDRAKVLASLRGSDGLKR